MKYVNNIEELAFKSSNFDIMEYRNQMANIKNTWLCKVPIFHRGFHDNKTDAPENSLRAFDNSCKKGYAIELDVRRLKDGTLVVFHDGDLKRMCGENIRLSSLTKEDLDKYNLLNSDQKIPTFDEVLNVVNGRVPLMVEVKSFALDGKIETSLYQKLKDYKGEYAVESYNPYTLNWFKVNAPEVYRGQLIENVDRYFTIGSLIPNMICNNKFSMPHFIASNKDYAHKIEKGDKPLIAWTVKTKEEYDKIVKYCDNVIFEKMNLLHQ